MKYRKNKVKREHGIIEGALLWLEELGRQPEVTDIIPGVIEVSRSPERGVVYKYETHTGCKLLLKSNGSVQEAFVVTKNPELVRAWVERNFPAGTKESRQAAETQTVKETEPKSAPERKEKFSQAKPVHEIARRKQRYQSANASELCDAAITDYARTLGELDSPSLGESLNPGIRQKLRALQKNLAAKGNKKNT